MNWAVSLWVKAHIVWFCTLPVTRRLTKGSERRKSGIIKGFFLIVSLETHDHQDDMFSELRWILKSQLLVSNNKKGKKRNNHKIKILIFSHSEHDKKKERNVYKIWSNDTLFLLWQFLWWSPQQNNVNMKLAHAVLSKRRVFTYDTLWSLPGTLRVL